MAQYPPIVCPVCRTPFSPRRSDQIFCSKDDQQECLQRLWTLERDPQTITEFMKALHRQDGKCFICQMPGGGSLSKLRVLIRFRFAEPSDDQPNIVAAHMPCRRGYYWAQEQLNLLDSTGTLEQNEAPLTQMTPTPEA